MSYLKVVAAALAGAVVLAVMPAMPAMAAGVGEVCDGAARCEGGSFCDLRPGSCGGLSREGICVHASSVCTRIYMPVCGCNGATYANDCTRRAARVSKAANGRCG